MTIDTEDLRQQLESAVEPLTGTPTAYARIGAGIARRRRTRLVARSTAAVAVAALGVSVAVLAVPGGGGDGPTARRPTSAAPTAPGRSLVTVPDVRGRPLLGATQALSGLGLRVTAREQTEPNAPRGRVVGEYPVPGTRVRPHVEVTLVYVGGRPVDGDLDADGRPDRFGVEQVGSGEAVLVGDLTTAGEVRGAPFRPTGRLLAHPHVVDVNGDGIGEVLVGMQGGVAMRYRLYAYAGHALSYVPVWLAGGGDGEIPDGGTFTRTWGFDCTGAELVVAAAHRAGGGFAAVQYDLRLDGTSMELDGAPVRRRFPDSASAAYWAAGNSCGMR